MRQRRAPHATPPPLHPLWQPRLSITPLFTLGHAPSRRSGRRRWSRRSGRTRRRPRRRARRRARPPRPCRSASGRCRTWAARWRCGARPGWRARGSCWSAPSCSRPSGSAGLGTPVRPGARARRARARSAPATPGRPLRLGQLRGAQRPAASRLHAPATLPGCSSGPRPALGPRRAGAAGGAGRRARPLARVGARRGGGARAHAGRLRRRRRALPAAGCAARPRGLRCRCRATRARALAGAHMARTPVRGPAWCRPRGAARARRRRRAGPARAQATARARARCWRRPRARWRSAWASATPACAPPRAAPRTCSPRCRRTSARGCAPRRAPYPQRRFWWLPPAACCFSALERGGWPWAGPGRESAGWPAWQRGRARQVAAARRRADVLQQVVGAFGQSRELGEVRSRAALWDGGDGVPGLV